MASKSKLRKRAKRAAIKKKYSDIKNNKSKRVDDRVSYINTMKLPEDVKVNEEDLNRKFFRSLSKYRNKNLFDK
ncbi:hypothetical protein ACFL6I_17020 [candidate division KSB1 bacterium]